MSLGPGEPPTGQPFSVRPMAAADVPAVVAIDKLSFPAPWPASSYLYEILENKQSFYSVLVRPAAARSAGPKLRFSRWLRSVMALPPPGEIAGYVGFRIYRREAHITTIAIHPTWRGRGLGEHLIAESMEKALRLGVHRVTLEVRPSNPAAQQLYQKYGFQFTGSRKGYYSDGEDARLMAADVGADGYRVRLRMLRSALADRLAADGIRVGQVPVDGV